MTRTAFAQTNIQLYNELRECGYAMDELVAVRRAYETAMILHAGDYRRSGRPFVCHLVGTASCVAAAGGPPDLVRAALLHAVFSHRFRRTIPERERRFVRRAIGGRAERIVAAYTHLAWNRAGIERAQRELDGLDAEPRDAVVLRLANAVDDCSDLGLLYSAEEKGRREELVWRKAVFEDLAVRLGRGELRAMIASVFDQALRAEVPRGLQRSQRLDFAGVPLRWTLRYLARPWIRLGGWSTRRLRVGLRPKGA
jgi:(p)ppGpp synthase/HD superfamily hydrolase